MTQHDAECIQASGATHKKAIKLGGVAVIAFSLFLLWRGFGCIFSCDYV